DGPARPRAAAGGRGRPRRAHRRRRARPGAGGGGQGADPPGAAAARRRGRAGGRHRRRAGRHPGGPTPPAAAAAAPPRPPGPDGPTTLMSPPSPPGPAPAAAPRPLTRHDRSVRRLMLAAVAVVLATVAGVVVGWSYLRSNVPTHEVPDLVGMQADEAEATVADFDWRVVREEEHRDGTEEGEVLATRPAAGERLREGERLVLVVSLGPALVDVPDYLIGMTQEEAEAEMEAVGLQADFVPQPSRSFDEGVVTGYVDEDVPDQLPRGSTVSLYVSSGDEVEVPDLEGLPYADAVTRLEDLGLEVRLESEQDD